jgi:hypothetical protein
MEINILPKPQKISTVSSIARGSVFRLASDTEPEPAVFIKTWQECLSTGGQILALDLYDGEIITSHDWEDWETLEVIEYKSELKLQEDN